MYFFSLNVYDFAKYSSMSCQENKPMLYYAYSKNKFVILNEIFFLTDLHLSKIVHIILDMSYEQFSYQAEQKSWTFNEQFT